MKHLLVFILPFCIGTSCKITQSNINNLNNNTITVLGHGGMGSRHMYPMNSFESVTSCLSLSTDGSEIDVQMTKDSVLIAFHDHDLWDDTKTKGKVHDFKWEQIQDLEYRGNMFRSYAVISLDQLFSNLNNSEQYLYTFDCKLYNSTSGIKQYYETYSNAILALIDKYQLKNNICIESQSPEFLNILQQKDSTLKLFYYPSDFETGLAVANQYKFYGITISTDKITAEQVQIAHSKNLRVALWGVQTAKENTSAIRKSPDYIQTDKVKRLVKILNQD